LVALPATFLLPARSREGDACHDLSWTTATFWVAAVACVVAQVAIVRSVLVARAPR
jgi:hypothetical protein